MEIISWPDTQAMSYWERATSALDFMQSILEAWEHEELRDTITAMVDLFKWTTQWGQAFRNNKDERIWRINLLFGPWSSQRIYNMKFKRVKVISRLYPFLCNYKGLWVDYIMYNNMLWIDTIFTEVYIPDGMRCPPIQRQIILKK